MSDLAEKKCVACDGNIPPFDTTEIHKYLKKVDGWDVKSDSENNFYHRCALHPIRLLFLDSYGFHFYQKVECYPRKEYIFY